MGSVFASVGQKFAMKIRGRGYKKGSISVNNQPRSIVYHSKCAFLIALYDGYNHVTYNLAIC